MIFILSIMIRSSTSQNWTTHILAKCNLGISLYQNDETPSTKHKAYFLANAQRFIKLNGCNTAGYGGLSNSHQATP